MNFVRFSYIFPNFASDAAFVATLRGLLDATQGSLPFFAVLNDMSLTFEVSPWCCYGVIALHRNIITCHFLLFLDVSDDNYRLG
jgi:hypothetical protein